MKDSIKYQWPEGLSTSSVLYNKVNLLWRLLATAFGFALFGFGGIAMVLTIFPIIIICSKNQHDRSSRVRFVIRYIFRFYLSIISCLGVTRVETKGLDQLQGMRGKLVVCNHPSLLDVVIIISRLKKIQCVVNNKLWGNMIVGPIVRAANYIRNDMEPELFLDKCKEALAQGDNIIIFPEGTRSVPGQPIKLLRGFANLALAAQADIQVLTLDCKPSTLIKGAKWYDVSPSRIKYLLQTGPCFPCNNPADNTPRSIRVREIVREIQQYYERYLS